ncbi:hypothetical protein FOA52_000154 [Chlamydomonas sp. UWO 241]|nr:hypothetical protein FOA52_000154 [Chlamydomonas sp. UWO 241]
MGTGGGARHGGGVSLEKFAEAKKSTYDKKAALAVSREEELRKRSKYKKLKSRLAAEGVQLAAAPQFTDNVAALEAELVSPEFREAQEARQRPQKRKRQGGAEAVAGAAPREEDDGRGQGAHASSSSPPFLPSQRFQGSRPGYKFQKGPQGIGYYVDTVQQQRGTQQVQTKKERHAAQAVASGQRQEEEQQQQQGGSARAAARDASAAASAPAVPGSVPHGRQPAGAGARTHAPTQLERLASKVQGDKQAARAAREAAAAERAARDARVRESQRHRSGDRHKMLMRTPKGQPLMKFRMDKILSVLERERQG